MSLQVMLDNARQMLEAWRERLHPEASREQVALALGLAAGGAVLALFGVLTVALGDFVLPRGSWLRELGFLAAAGGLPIFLTGLVVGLPARLWTKAIAAVGLAGITVGLGLFSLWYPDQWHLTVQTPNIYAIVAYMAGISLLAAAASAQLATYFVEQARGTGQTDEDGRPVTDEEIADDIAWAENQGWSWGGIRKSGVNAEIQLKPDAARLKFKGMGARVYAEQESAEQALQAVSALSSLRGKKDPTTDAAVGDQVANLKQLKQRQASQEAAKRETWGWKLTHPIQWLRGS